MRALGIDPGLSGGIALVDGFGQDSDRAPRFVCATEIPTKGDGAKRRVDVNAVAGWLDANGPIDIAFIERAQLMRGQSVSAGTVYMRAVGALEAVAELGGMPLETVETVVWKRALGVIPVKIKDEKTHQRKGRSKTLSLRKAVALFPNAASMFERKKDHNLAEAALIAYHGLRIKWMA